MSCADCELLLAQGETGALVENHLRECAGCRMLAADLAANAAILEAFRTEELPRIVVKIPRRKKLYPWVAGVAAAAAFAIGSFSPRPAAPPEPFPPAPTPPAVSTVPRPEPLKIKMLTPDPSVVIYWIVD
jgi:hypothetical protein